MSFASEAQKQKALEFLLGVEKACKGVRWFLMHGVLLGAVREKDFIDHDFDIDLGAVPEDMGKLDIIIDRLIETGFIAYECRVPKYGPTGRFVQMHYKGVSGHLTFHLPYGPESYHYDREYMKKPDMREVHGHRFPVPQDCVKWLGKEYGDWKTPRLPNDPNMRKRKGDHPHVDVISRDDPKTDTMVPRGAWHG